MKQRKQFIQAETIIAVLARRIGIDPNDLAVEWEVENGEFKGVVLIYAISDEEAAAIAENERYRYPSRRA